MVFSCQKRLVSCAIYWPICLFSLVWSNHILAQVCPLGSNNTDLLTEHIPLYINDPKQILLYPDGVEPGDASRCEAPQGSRCWYVDAAAPDGGDGSFATPYNSFETVVGYRRPNTNYETGLIRGGDYLYVTGTFDGANHIEDSHELKIEFGNGIQGGSVDYPTIIKSYPGRPRAIFDGNFTYGPIRVTALATRVNGGVKVENIEVKNAKGIGIFINEYTVYVHISGVVVHDTEVVNGSSNSGGVVFRASTEKHDYTLENSWIYNNHRINGSSGGTDVYPVQNNNIGGVSVFGQHGAQDGSKAIIKNNVIERENQGIRHKHSGNVITEAHGNIIFDVFNGFYLVDFAGNFIHHNVLFDLNVAVQIVGENLRGDMCTEFYHNTVVGASSLVSSGNDHTEGFRRQANFHDNIFVSDRSLVVLNLGSNTTDFYDLDDWQSARNMVYVPDTSEFLAHGGQRFDLPTALTLLDAPNQTPSFIIDDPLFVNAEQYNFNLQTESPAIAAALGGRSLGALNATMMDVDNTLCFPLRLNQGGGAVICL